MTIKTISLITTLFTTALIAIASDTTTPQPSWLEWRPHGPKSTCMATEHFKDGRYIDWYPGGRAKLFAADGTFLEHKRSEMWCNPTEKAKIACTLSILASRPRCKKPPSPSPVKETTCSGCRMLRTSDMPHALCSGCRGLLSNKPR